MFYLKFAQKSYPGTKIKRNVDGRVSFPLLWSVHIRFYFVDVVSDTNFESRVVLNSEQCFSYLNQALRFIAVTYNVKYLFQPAFDVTQKEAVVGNTT